MRKFYPRSFGFAFVGFANMFIPLLSIFFSFFLGIAAVLGFTSICTSIVSVDCFYKERFFISFLFVSTVPTGNVFLLQQILSEALLSWGLQIYLLYRHCRSIGFYEYLHFYCICRLFL